MADSPRTPKGEVPRWMARFDRIRDELAPGFQEVLDKAISEMQVDLHASAPSETAAPGWIRAEERKPDMNQEVLIYHVLGDRDRDEVPHSFDVAWWTQEGWLFPWDRGDRQRPRFVTHWKPLPEAPK